MSKDKRPAKSWPYHVIYGADLMGLLERAHEGESPSDIYLEAYVNSKKDYTPDPKPVKKPKKGSK